jgi:hypothetical protein
MELTVAQYLVGSFFEMVPILVRIVNSTLLSFQSGTYDIFNGCYQYSVGRTAFTCAVGVNNSCLNVIPLQAQNNHSCREDVEGDHKCTVVQRTN